MEKNNSAGWSPFITWPQRWSPANVLPSIDPLTRGDLLPWPSSPTSSIFFHLTFSGRPYYFSKKIEENFRVLLPPHPIAQHLPSAWTHLPEPILLNLDTDVTSHCPLLYHQLSPFYWIIAISFQWLSFKKIVTSFYTSFSSSSLFPLMGQQIYPLFAVFNSVLYPVQNSSHCSTKTVSVKTSKLKADNYYFVLSFCELSTAWLCASLLFKVLAYVPAGRSHLLVFLLPQWPLRLLCWVLLNSPTGTWPHLQGSSTAAELLVPHLILRLSCQQSSWSDRSKTSQNMLNLISTKENETTEIPFPPESSQNPKV